MTHPAIETLRSMTCTGSLAIDGFPLSTDAWSTVHLIPLWTLGEVRGSDIDIPGTAGSRPYPRRLTATAYDLKMLFTGLQGPYGIPSSYANFLAGLEANVALVSNGIVAQPGGPDGTRTATLTLPSGATRTAPVHVGKLELGDPDPNDGCLWRAVLRISVPSGALV